MEKINPKENNWWILLYIVHNDTSYILSKYGQICSIIATNNHTTPTLIRRNNILKSHKTISKYLALLEGCLIIKQEKQGREKRFYFTDNVKEKTRQWLIKIQHGFEKSNS